MNTIDRQELKNRLIQEGYVEAFGLDQTIDRLLNLDGKAAEMLKAWMDEGIIPEFDEIEGIDSKVLREQLKMKEPAAFFTLIHSIEYIMMGIRHQFEFPSYLLFNWLK